ncbi:hypothetical protein ONZ45_g4871 [Pleurotus djamor]|nr:hypothetical protein ONZ45_g4871 [Pleurotus djamor]
MQFQVLAALTILACASQILGAPTVGSNEKATTHLKSRTDDSGDAAHKEATAQWWHPFWRVHNIAVKTYPYLTVPAPPAMPAASEDSAEVKPDSGLLNYKTPGYAGNQSNKWAHGGVNTISGNSIYGTNTITNGGVSHSNDD